MPITESPYCLDNGDFSGGGKPEYPDKNLRSTGEINYGNSTHMKYHTRLGFSGERHNALIACTIRASLYSIEQTCDRIAKERI